MTAQIAGAIGPALVGMALVKHSVASVYTAWGLLMAACILGFLVVPRLKVFLSLDHDESQTGIASRTPHLQVGGASRIRATAQPRCALRQTICRSRPDRGEAYIQAAPQERSRSEVPVQERVRLACGLATAAVTMLSLGCAPH